MPLPLEEEEQQAGPTGGERRQRLLYEPRSECPCGREQVADAILTGGGTGPKKKTPRAGISAGVGLIDDGTRNAADDRGRQLTRAAAWDGRPEWAAWRGEAVRSGWPWRGVRGWGLLASASRQPLDSAADGQNKHSCRGRRRATGGRAGGGGDLTVSGPEAR